MRRWSISRITEQHFDRRGRAAVAVPLAVPILTGRRCAATDDQQVCKLRDQLYLRASDGHA